MTMDGRIFSIVPFAPLRTDHSLPSMSSLISRTDRMPLSFR